MFLSPERNIHRAYQLLNSANQGFSIRQAVAMKIGLGFELPAKNRDVGPNGPKIEFQSVPEIAASA
jgi:hypothetical protein